MPAHLFASPEVPVERAAVRDALRLLDLHAAAQKLDPALGVEALALTPDLHRASPAPVGTALRTRGVLTPHLIGNDLGCGMRLHLTGLRADDLRPHLDVLERELRAVFFQGQRALSLTGRQREALLRGGVPDLLAAPRPAGQRGLWDLLGAQAHQPDPHAPFVRGPLHGVRDWLGDRDRASFDTQLGSVGGGNHFVEVQEVAAVLDRHAAYAWGVRPGEVVVMVHSGSLGFGHLFGAQLRAPARAAPGAPLPLLPADHPGVPGVLDALHAAAHLASGNRLMLACMVRAALGRALPPGLLAQDQPFPALADAPHNFIWPGGDGDWVHRKGATPAAGPSVRHPHGEPVLIPGSMGDLSYLLAGQGHPLALGSASHGAGRRQPRGAAMRQSDAEALRALEALRVVTPTDLRTARSEIRARALSALKQEAPGAYKAVTPIIDTHARAGLARPVAALRPLLTVKSL
ncbi:RNA-splicing ligase RtcB [Deinococcus radiotolerans]|uniref:tRNA-splicing ligase RtcB n=1 Tax=Deinococcus radiotolerans TaxID=1309407 RepID=A0ABQ2FMS1_9DEIO|nr:RNA-splicing ligase RtcB [Deinococcus radiotolerans]